MDEGEGPTVVVLHGGLENGSRFKKVADRLTPRLRVVRVHRRRYRLDLTPPSTIAQEVEDVRAVVAALGGGPALLVGHSSGGVVALEAALALPEAFNGLVLYEPPVPFAGVSLGGTATAAAEAALARGRRGKAMEIFLWDVVRLPPRQAWLAGMIIRVHPEMRAFAPRQIDDLRAIDQLGERLDAYRAIEIPTVLLGGETSPAHLGERLDALGRVLPKAERVTLPGEGHGGHVRCPDQIARIIEEHWRKVAA